MFLSDEEMPLKCSWATRPDGVLHAWIIELTLFRTQHEGREVTAGEKWIIRSDVCVRR